MNLHSKPLNVTWCHVLCKHIKMHIQSILAVWMKKQKTKKKNQTAGDRRWKFLRTMIRRYSRTVVHAFSTVSLQGWWKARALINGLRREGWEPRNIYGTHFITGSVKTSDHFTVNFQVRNIWLQLLICEGKCRRSCYTNICTKRSGITYSCIENVPVVDKYGLTYTGETHFIPFFAISLGKSPKNYVFTTNSDPCVWSLWLISTFMTTSEGTFIYITHLLMNHLCLVMAGRSQGQLMPGDTLEHLEERQVTQTVKNGLFFGVFWPQIENLLNFSSEET